MLVFLDDLKFGFCAFTKMIKLSIVCHACIMCVLNFSLLYIYPMGVKLSMEKFYKFVF